MEGNGGAVAQQEQRRERAGGVPRRADDQPEGVSRRAQQRHGKLRQQGDESRSMCMRYTIREKRKAAGLSQAKVAELLGISTGLYNMLENGKRRMNETYLEGIATILKVRPSTLIAEDDDSAGEFLDLFILLDEAYRGRARSYLDFLKPHQVWTF